MGVDRPRPQVAAAGVRQAERPLAVDQRSEEHDDAARAPRRGHIDPVEVQRGRAPEFELGLVVRPGRLHTDALQHLEDAVDLLNLGDAAQDRPSAVQQGRAQEGDGGVLRGAHVDLAVEGALTVDPQVRGTTGAGRDELGIQCRRDAVDHVQTQVLAPDLDAMDRALTGAERLRELLLGQAALLTRVPDDAADAGR